MELKKYTKLAKINNVPRDGANLRGGRFAKVHRQSDLYNGGNAMVVAPAAFLCIFTIV